MEYRTPVKFSHQQVTTYNTLCIDLTDEWYVTCICILHLLPTYLYFTFDKKTLFVVVILINGYTYNIQNVVSNFLIEKEKLRGTVFLLHSCLCVYREINVYLMKGHLFQLEAEVYFKDYNKVKYLYNDRNNWMPWPTNIYFKIIYG